MERLVVIDGHAILHRAYHALPPLTTREGAVVNAVYGFASILLRVITDLKPDYLMVAFDHPVPTFRKQIFKDYQAQRPKMEDNLVSQIELVNRMVNLMGIPVYGLDGFEADDVIGTITRSMEKKDTETVIVTGDRDILQLVNDKVRVYLPIKGLSEAKMYGEAEVEEKFGIKPDRIADFKALAGDSSDNYPGVVGIGPKTAVELINKYGPIEEIYDNLDSISGNIKLKLEANKENAFLSKKLATIVCDCPVEVSLDEARLDSLDKPSVIKFFEDMEFKSLIARLKGKSDKSETAGSIRDKKKKAEQTSLF